MSASYFKHPMALVETETIGRDTRVWAFAHILPGAKLGAECNICDGVFIENDVVVGDRVTLKCGVQLWDGLRLEDDVFVGPNATFTNDRFPRSRQRPEKFAQTLIRAGASIGANATILPGLTIGKRAMVGAGAVVTCSVPADAIVVGNPARVVGYVGARQGERVATPESGASATRGLLGGASVQLVHLPSFRDLRGSLTVAELGPHLPFIPKRVFFVHDVPGRNVRGEHAHRELKQFLICVNGSCSVLLDDGGCREELRLDTRNLGLFVGPRIWTVQYKFSADAVLMVLASEGYDAADYIRDYDEFQALVGRRGQPAGDL